MQAPQPFVKQTQHLRAINLLTLHEEKILNLAQFAYQSIWRVWKKVAHFG